MGRMGGMSLLSPCPLSSEAEERGMNSRDGLPRVALSESLTRGYCLSPLRGLGIRTKKGCVTLSAWAGCGLEHQWEGWGTVSV